MARNGMSAALCMYPSFAVSPVGLQVDTVLRLLDRKETIHMSKVS